MESFTGETTNISIVDVNLIWIFNRMDYQFSQLNLNYFQ